MYGIKAREVTRLILIAILDENNGMMFHNRRQSQDRELRKKIFSRIGPSKLWVSPYTKKQFTGESPQIMVAEDPLLKAGDGEYCLVEDTPIDLAAHIEWMLIYRWKRKYPADVRFPFPLEKWIQTEKTTFQGHSHSEIDEEVYCR